MASVTVTGPAFASGFLIPEQGAKASSMAGAFTATADDPSAMFFNVAGIAQIRRTTVIAGADIIHFDNEFIGDPTDAFSAGSIGSYRAHVFTVPNAYATIPIGSNLTFGLGMFTAFGLRTNWEDPWIGRFASRDANVKTASFQPSIAWQSANGRVAIGAGAEYRRARLILSRNIAVPGTGVNPFTGKITDIGNAYLSSDWDSGWGWSAGVLLKPTDLFRIGASYRAPMDIDFKGNATFTKYATGTPLDAMIQLPPNQPMTTTMPFPAIAAIGIATTAIPSWDLEFDMTRTTWSRFEKLDVNFLTTPSQSFTRPQNWHDTTSYRIGANHAATPEWDVRLGLLYDENPQPVEAVSPLLPDADREGLTMGVGYHPGRFIFDAGALFLHFKTRGTEGRSTELNGTYKTNAILYFTNVGVRF